MPSSANELRAVGDSWLERWISRILRRSNVDKALLISAVSLVGRLANAAAIHNAAGRPSFLAVVHPEVLVQFERSMWLLCAFWGAMVAWGMLARRRTADSPVYVTLAVQGVTISGVWVAAHTGIYTSQSVLVVMGFLVLCYVAFPRRYYLPGAAVAGVLFVAASVAEWLQWIPYGALLLTAPGGLGAHPDRTFAFLGFIMILIALVLIGAALVFTVRRLRVSEALLREESRTDPLTGLANRRHLVEMTRHLLARGVRRSQPVSVLVIDVDHFKAVNDHFGHAAGDRVLTAVARTLDDLFREEDVIARLGGEEFVAVLPETGLREATAVAERCRREVEGAVIRVEGERCPITVSLGVAEHAGGPGPVPTAEEFIARADEALYRAKQAGRNCVRVDDLAPVPGS